ncbi:DgyrCDS1651 [Dimorphilus gyrociliatus]|uniref:non-specific serine/threonine protein kinase n=1 Tax=Dimorphilus gyrociliatus TaxID=2664684 RepID=A0A7I8V873_9ANNE|nr:DgyrCDS1651 [Dimorphilus gyrociliatus]
MPSSSGIEDYDVIEQIGSGSYGTCSKVRRKRDNRILVWKEMEYGGMTETEKQMLVSEVNLLRELRHEHIVRYHDRIIDRSRYVLYIVMEFCEGGDLSSIIGKCKRDGEFVSEDFVWKMCVHLSSALQFCHNRCIRGGRSILHRDLKPANIFLDSEQNAKLGDFGLARVLNHDNSFARTFVGTPYYMSPEQMNCMTYNEKSDVWSLGCLLYELCSLRPPFTASNQKELASKICKGKFPRIPHQFSDDLNNLIAALLRVEDYKRPTIDQVLDHPLLIKNGGGYLQLLQKKSSGSSVSSMKDSGDDKQRSLEFKHWEESLRSREEALKEKEELLRKRDEHIRLKEIRISQRENDVETFKGIFVCGIKVKKTHLEITLCIDGQAILNSCKRPITFEGTGGELIKSEKRLLC